MEQARQNASQDNGLLHSKCLFCYTSQSLSEFLIQLYGFKGIMSFPVQAAATIDSRVDLMSISIHLSHSEVGEHLLLPLAVQILTNTGEKRNRFGPYMYINARMVRL